MENRTHHSGTRPTVSNKQVVLIFMIGIFMMFVAFWAGLAVIKGSITPDAGENRNAVTHQKKATTAQEASINPAVNLESNATSETPTAETRYVIHVASCGTREEAEKYELELKRAGYLSAYVKQSTDGLYHVDIGIYKERQDAQQAANDLSLHYKQTMIYQNDKH
ncbi:MAG: SPOR domain-containing protein [Acidobacteriota bacterium]